MSNILIITAHRSSRKLTKGMANICKNQKETQGSKIKLTNS